MDFYKILKSITADNRLTFCDILVMSVLVTHAQYKEDRAVKISYNQIHKEFERLSLTSIRRSIRHLQELKYIDTISQKQGKVAKANLYKVLIKVPKVKSNGYEDMSDYESVINEFMQ